MPRKAKHPKGERDRERIAWAELNSLAVGEAFGGRLDKTRIVHEEAVPIHDLNGRELFHRIPLRAEEGGAPRRVGRRGTWTWRRTPLSASRWWPSPPATGGTPTGSGRRG